MTNTTSKKQVFFHVGTGKTGTTFLQYRVFPSLQGIEYIQRTRYKKSKQIIQKSQNTKLLVSREFDRQLQNEIEWFAESYPDATPIIVFRRQDSYIASQYRRFVKNGFTGAFTTFFDLENNQGFFEQKHACYMQQIALLEKTFNQKPIVLIYENLRKNPTDFIEGIANVMGASIDMKKVNLNKKHTSYSEKQLKAIRALGSVFNFRKRRVFKNGILHFFWRLYLGAIRYSTLYISKLIPNSLLPEQPLIDPEELEKVRQFYQNDWEMCLNYANKQSVSSSTDK